MAPFVVNYLCIFLLYTACGRATYTTYKEQFNNYSIYEVTAFNTRERAVLYTLHIRVDDMIFMNGITNEASLPMNVLVKKCCTHDFETIMHANDIEYVSVKPENIINRLEDNSVHYHHHSNTSKKVEFTKHFYCYDGIKLWVDQTIKKNNMLEVIKLGQTYEKRDIFVLKLSTGKTKKAVVLMGGEEGKDWTSPALLLNFVNNVLERKMNLEILTQHYDFYVLPLFNPDGYMYSMTKERMWTKNSRVYFPKKPCSENASVVGISIDRNWYFNKLAVRNEECDPIFTGSRPLSEEETIAVSRFLNKISLDMMAFINIRGFENLVTIPYGYEKIYCNNYDVLMDMLSAVHDSVVKHHNITFNYGLASKYVYNFSGNVADWVKKQLNTPIVYTFYMEKLPYLFPSAKDIKPLTAQLATMIKEILLLANTFYGPLFNKQLNCSVSSIILTIQILLYFIDL